MQRHIVNAFLSSAIVTENNKSNLLSLVARISDATIKNNYIQRIKAKQPAQKDSTLEYYLQDVKDKTRFATAWTYANEYIKEAHDQAKMQRHIVNAFLSSPVVTDLNKNNLLSLVAKIQDGDTRDAYTKKIKEKQISQKDSTLEY